MANIHHPPGTTGDLTSEENGCGSARLPGPLPDWWTAPDPLPRCAHCRRTDVPLYADGDEYICPQCEAWWESVMYGDDDFQP